MTLKTTITREDILSLEDFVKVRKDKRAEVVATKKNRRVGVGPFCTFYFENYTTMWWQIHEMLFIEKGGEEQIEDELRAYNPLIPKGDELVATVMFEIDDKQRREAVLRRLGGIENHILMTIDGERVEARPEEDVERTRADGKASAVQFVHFKLTPQQIAAFRRAGVQVVLGFDHPEYGHMAVMPEAVRTTLVHDFAPDAAAAA